VGDDRASLGDRGPRIIRRSFRRKLGAALLVVLLITSGMTLGLYLQVGGLLDDDVEQSMTAAASAEAGELNEWVAQKRLVARLLSDHPVYQSDTAAIRSFLRDQQSSQVDASIEQAFVIDRGEEVVTTSVDPALEGTAVAALPWQERFAFQSFDSVRLTDPYQLKDGTHVVGFISPITEQSGSLLVVAFETSAVFDRFEHPVEGGLTRVVNSNGTIVFADTQSATLTQYLRGSPRAPIVSSGLRGTTGFTDEPAFEAEMSEAGVVAAYAPVPGTDWVVVEHAPAASAYAILGEARQWILAVTAVGLVGLLSVIGLLGRDVTTALAGLRRRTRQIEQGDYDVDFDVDRPDEFGALNRALATMRDTLRERIEEIETTSADLAATNRTLQERSQMVRVLNRILRHNVRNDVNVILGRAEIAAERATDPRTSEDMQEIHDVAEELARLSDRTRRITHLVAESEDTAAVDLAARLPAALGPLDDASNDATVAIDIAADLDPVSVPAPLPDAVGDVVGLIVDNAEGPVAVEVTLSRTDCEDGSRGVQLRIEDDGNGLPAMDVEAVTSRTETALEHADGVGLWLLEWTAEEAGGTLQLNGTDATLELTFPVE
jgi:signal transduction histidine kinase